MAKFEIDKFKMSNYGSGFISKYLFTTFDDWGKFKQSIGFGVDKYPGGIDPASWIEPDRVPFIMLYIYDGEGWYNLEFVYPDDFPKLYFYAGNTEQD
jgi:hypothetical protein